MTLFQVKILQSKLPGLDQNKIAANVVKKCQVTEEKVFKSAPLSAWLHLTKYKMLTTIC